MEDHTSPSLFDQQIKHIQESYRLAMSMAGVSESVIEEVQKSVEDAIVNNMF